MFDVLSDVSIGYVEHGRTSNGHKAKDRMLRLRGRGVIKGLLRLRCGVERGVGYERESDCTVMSDRDCLQV